MRRTQLSAAGSVLFLAAVGSLSQLASFCYRVALSRSVGAEVMGLYQLIIPVYSVLLSLTAVGGTCAVSNLTPQYLALNNSKGVRQTLRLALIFFFCSLIPVGAAVIFFSDPISVYFLGDARTQLGLMLLVPCVALTGVENIHKHFFYGAGLVRPPAIADLVEQLVRAGAVLGLLVVLAPAYPEKAAGTIVLGMILCEISSALTLTILYQRKIRAMGVSGPGERGPILYRRLASIAVPTAFTALLGNLMGAANASLLPRLLVQRGLTQSEAVAQFGVICGMTLPMLSLPTVLLGALNLVLIPKLSRSIALNRPKDVHRQIHRALQIISVTMLPAMGILSVIGGDLGPLLFSQNDVGAYLLPLALATALSCYHSTLSASLNGIGKQFYSAMVSILCNAGQLAATMFLVPSMGMSGFVVGTVIASLCGALLCGWLLVRFTGLEVRLFQWVTAPGLATLLMALTGNLLYHYLKDAGVSLSSAIFIYSVFSVVFYLTLLQAQGLQAREIFRFRA